MVEKMQLVGYPFVWIILQFIPWPTCHFSILTLQPQSDIYIDMIYDILLFIKKTRPPGELKEHTSPVIPRCSVYFYCNVCMYVKICACVFTAFQGIQDVASSFWFRCFLCFLVFLLFFICLVFGICSFVYSSYKHQKDCCTDNDPGIQQFKVSPCNSAKQKYWNHGSSASIIIIILYMDDSTNQYQISICQFV